MNLKDNAKKVIGILVVIINIALLISLFLGSISVLLYGMYVIGYGSIVKFFTNIVWGSVWLAAIMLFFPKYLKIHVHVLEKLGLDDPIFDESV